MNTNSDNSFPLFRAVAAQMREWGEQMQMFFAALANSCALALALPSKWPRSPQLLPCYPNPNV